MQIPKLTFHTLWSIYMEYNQKYTPQISFLDPKSSALKLETETDVKVWRFWANLCCPAEYFQASSPYKEIFDLQWGIWAILFKKESFVNTCVHIMVHCVGPP